MTRPFYTLVHWWLGMLPVDAAGRRAFDETLADWRREAALVRSPTGRCVVAVKAVFATIRCVAGVGGREAAQLLRTDVVTRVVFWTLGYIVLMRVISDARPTPRGFELSAWSGAYLSVSLSAYFLPVALMLATTLGRRSRIGSGVGLSIAACLAGFVLLGWAVPTANRNFLDENRGRYTNPQTQAEREWRSPYHPGDGLAQGMADLSLPSLMSRIVNGPDGQQWFGIRWMSSFGAYLGMCAIAPILASVLRQRTALIRYSMLAATVFVIFGRSRVQFLESEFSVVLWLGAFWIPVIWMIACLIAVSWQSPVTANNK